ncbi:MAG TPA: ATP-dependent DNA helicase [Blastocatellia bacterium]|nr:ATP-dependent DNA helicase [Blastocatellia bacterium]
MEEIFGPQGLIARHHPDYEYRPGQVAMAEAVAHALENRHHLLVEAGTGTGKTLAYLVPAVGLGKRVVVSTGTKNLQEQLYFKDIPFLQKVLPRKFRATYLKGRANYLCLQRLKRAESNPVLDGLDEVDYFDQVRRWAFDTQTGDRAELSELPENIGFWRHIDARSDTCLGTKCPNFDPCFITRARQNALDSDVIIVNHHLFFADLALRGREWGQVLPDYAAVIFDEAHQIEDIASTYFGAMISSYQLEDLIGDISRLALTDVDAAREITKAGARTVKFAENFWMSFDAASRLLPVSANAEGRFTLRPQMFVRTSRTGEQQATPAGERFMQFRNALERLIGSLGIVKDPPPEMEAILRRAEQFRFDLEFIIEAADANFVYWCERRGRGTFLQATPTDVSGLLEDRLFSKTETVILTSATLTSAGSFDFIRQRLGLEESAELIAESNYDYKQQALLYLPPRMPDPRDAGFTDAAAEEIVKILNATEGRAFVLCTSNSSMQALRQIVEPQIEFPVLMQGEGSRTGLLDKFRKTGNCVLFATASFWQGVDVRGEALSCVIIDKLPFAVPTDPVVAARQRQIDEQGGSSFTEYSVPSAIISLKQGIGRLIRSATDRGVLAILDPRLTTKNYGRLFLESLPSCPVTRSIEQVEQFFS